MKNNIIKFISGRRSFGKLVDESSNSSTESQSPSKQNFELPNQIDTISLDAYREAVFLNNVSIKLNGRPIDIQETARWLQKFAEEESQLENQIKLEDRSR